MTRLLGALGIVIGLMMMFGSRRITTNAFRHRPPAGTEAEVKRHLAVFRAACLAAGGVFALAGVYSLVTGE